MVTQGAMTHQLSVLTGVCVCAALLITGLSQSICNTSVDALDLGCLLRWDCHNTNSTSTTYSVQAKTQGGPWQDVAGCVQVSSHSCDVSQAFSDFDLYNMIRLGLHQGPGSPVWNQPCKFDPSDFTFSPPSVSVSLHGDKLVVEVQFPCSPHRGCSLQGCCPVSWFIDPWTTITVYNQLNISNYQTQTSWAQEVMFTAEFSRLVPGQEYCAVANFSFGPPTFPMASSPSSHPQCVKTAPPSELKGFQPVLLGTGTCTVLLVPFLILLLLKKKKQAPAMKNLPKSLVPQASLQDPVSLGFVDPNDIHVELMEDHLSILSSCSCVYTAEAQAQAPSLGYGYNNPFRGDSRSDGDCGGIEQGLNSTSTLPLLCSTVLLHTVTQLRVDQPQQPPPGPMSPMPSYPGSPPLIESVEGCVEDLGVPLCSVRFGVCEGEGDGELENFQWCNISMNSMVQLTSPQQQGYHPGGGLDATGPMKE